MTVQEHKRKPLVHRMAVLTVLLIWPLIWVGGLVTTYDAGMSVPDWPNTFGYNLLLYPYKTWLLGPFDLFIEHGHRLLGILVGIAAIGFLVASFASENRRWVKGLSIVTLLLVIIQGGLGGVRVLLSDRVFAMLHGSTAPIVFATAVAGAVVTGRWWQRNRAMPRKQAPEEQAPEEQAPEEQAPEEQAPEEQAPEEQASKEQAPEERNTEGQSQESQLAETAPLVPNGSLPLIVSLISICYVQLVLGAKIRHLQPDESAEWFLYTVWAHVIVAFVILILTGLAWYRLRKSEDLGLTRPGGILVGLTAVQVALGIITWVVNYGWPSFLQWLPGTDGHLIISRNFVDALLITGHVAVGPLILAAAVVIGLRLLRLQFLSRHSVQ